MSRKKLMEALRGCGKSSISGRELENCYTADLMIALGITPRFALSYPQNLDNPNFYVSYNINNLWSYEIR